MEKAALRPIAVDVAKKCDVLPVAIVTIANALRGESVHVCENALEELRRSAPTNIRGVSKDVYSCLELQSYNHLESDEVKSLFLLCGVLGLGDIYMDFLLLYALGLNLFKGFYSWEKAANKLITLVGLQEEWQWMNECRNCTHISLKCRNIDELPQGLVCPKLLSSFYCIQVILT